MNSTTGIAAFDRAALPVLGILSAEQAQKIIDYHSDSQLQRRIENLARRANEGELTSKEREEYQGYVEANHFVAILQSQARRLLEHAPESQ